MNKISHKATSVLFVAILVLSQVLSCLSKDELVFPGKQWERHESFEAAGFTSEAMREVRRFIIDSLNTTGLVVVVNGKIIRPYGDIEELSYLASCRKSILAMMYGNYVENGRIDLDKTLEELKIDDHGGLLPIEKKATVRDLITARSGVYHPASNGGDSSADAPERGSQNPGTYFLYNNWDFNAAGAIFEQLTGVNIYDALEKDLAIPLQMQDFDRTAQRKTGDLARSQYPAYHIWLSTRDMARIGYLMLRNGRWNGEQIIPENWVKEMVRVVTPLDEMNPERLRSGYLAYGYMWWIWQGEGGQGPFEGAYTARGAFGQYITVLPKLDMVIAHKTKSAYRRVTPGGQYEKLLRMIVAARR